MKSTLSPVAAPGTSPGVSSPRTSEILRGILTKNPGVQTFSVERILASIGEDRFEASLMMFSIPALVPVPSPKGVVTVPTSTIACQLLTGQRQIKLPRFILRKSVSRRALAVAIHAILPALEAAERVLRPRWSWVTHSSARRAIACFVFLLALAIAYPLFGFNPLHATSIFVMALGMAEQDGLAVLIGAAVGVLSLAMLATSGLSARALRAKAGNWLRKVGRKLGMDVLLNFLRRRGYTRIARLLTIEWADILMLWDPEKNTAQRTAAARPAPPKSLPASPRLGVSAVVASSLTQVPVPARVAALVN